MMTDPIADMLTRIRNGGAVCKKQVEMPASKVKKALAKLLLDEGYIADYSVSEGVKSKLTITLKYYEGKQVIFDIKRVSRPGARIYKAMSDLPYVMGGLGVAVISTSKGLMTDRQARVEGHGGEVLCFVF